jgi:hypothetical protein
MQLYLKTLHGGSGSSSIRGKQLARERMKEKGEISEEEEVEHVMMTIILSLLSLSLSISGWAQTSVKCLWRRPSKGLRRRKTCTEIITYNAENCHK